MKDKNKNKNKQEKGEWRSSPYNKYTATEELVEELQYDVDGDVDDLEATGSQCSTSYDASQSGSESSIKQQSLNVEKTTKRTRIAALMVVLVGAIAGAGFLYMGISSAKKDQEAGFVRAASDFSKNIEVAWGDYEAASLYIHESCRNWRDGEYTREDFRVLYYYLQSGGLEFFAAQWTPNVTRTERAALEAEANATFGHLEGYNYKGFKGWEPDPENPGETAMLPRSEQPFYFPIHYVEPSQNFKDIGHYDIYSAPWVKPAFDTALTTWKPALSNPFRLAQHTEEHGFSTSIYHPGVPVPNSTITPLDLANLVVYIPDLMKRAALSSSQSLNVYLYDNTNTIKDDTVPPQYLSALEILVSLDHDVAKEDLTLIQETPYKLVKNSSTLFYEKEVVIANKVWILAATNVEGTFQENLAFVWMGGILIFVASVLLAVWMIHNMHRSIQMHRVLSKAAAEASIVQNLFPANVRERILADAAKKNQIKSEKALRKAAFENDGQQGHTKRLNMLSSEGIFGSRPIADLHPYTTVMCADLVGFTAWASIREPTQVFTLLEIIYHSWDNIAKHRRVFKVETVGDSYVAVAGLPNPRKDHAVVMARFATDCSKRMQKLLKALEKTLGPDTGDLGCRFGLHSGQCVAGVLRGDKGRFQLFGDTINMASRMESAGCKNMIQVSPETAELLQAAGHSNWLEPRSDLVNVKGKGMMQTFFVHIRAGSRGSIADDDSEKGQKAAGTTNADDGKQTRLIEWTVEVLSGQLRSILARRAALGKETKKLPACVPPLSLSQPLDEVAEIITLPEFCGTAFQKEVDSDSIELDPEVVQQLTDFVTEISSGYRNNSFHNFEHACHVTMSVIKMLGRVVNPKKVAVQAEGDQSKLDADLHDHTFGINSDPLTQFACTFSAIIHDLDHQGVTNAALVNEESPLAVRYKQKSVAEQNSVNLAWALLCKPEYEKLRACLCCDEEEFTRFRQLVVNAVMATDIMDKALGQARKDRWNKAFSTDGSYSNELFPEETEQDKINRKATIVIEHLIQASDIAHTMQHWHVYAKWNERLFHEMYRAYRGGRLNTDPSKSWYQGEIGFFDYYIIPLAKKLFTCGVFGVSSDEFLNYALINRKEWEKKGEQMVKQYLMNHEQMYGEDEKPEEIAEQALPVYSKDIEV